jgi:hypothetical protein
MALRPHLAAGLPFAPKHWQIHHRAYIDRLRQTLIPEIRVTSRENLELWTPVQLSRRIPMRIPRLAVTSAAERRANWEAMICGGLPEALVIGKEGADVVADAERRGEMDGVEAAQAGRVNGRRPIQQRIAQGQKGHVEEPGPRLLGIPLPVAPARADRLDAEEGARNVAAVLGEFAAEGNLLRLP